MNSTGFPLQKYFERIGLRRPPQCDLEGLRQLHSGHAFSIPFENLDIHLGQTISLKPEDLVSKILHRKRGGYCFEMNGLFFLALTALDFEVRQLTARVLYGRTDPGPRTHHVLIVTIEGREWLADVGFGGHGLRLPIAFGTDQVQEQYGERYRLKRDPKLGTVLQKETQSEILDLYAFREDELTLQTDLEMGNHFTSTWPASIFRLRRMCSLAQPWGRITLSNMDLTISRDGQSISRVLSAGPEYMSAIAEHFGIHLNARYEDLAPLPNEYKGIRMNPNLSAISNEIKNRARIYVHIVEELSKEVGREKALEIFKRALYARGSEKGLQLKARIGNPDLHKLAIAFVEGNADMDAFGHEIVQEHKDHVLLRLNRCPLVDAWKESGLTPAEQMEMCDIAYQVDFGKFETAGYRLSFSCRIADGCGSCDLKVTL